MKQIDAYTVNGHQCRQDSRIIACAVCGGSGVEDHEELTSYHNRDYRYWTEPCRKCGGEGRLVEVEAELTVNASVEGFGTTTLSHKFRRLEKLDGRSTEDIYNLGRK